MKKRATKSNEPRSPAAISAARRGALRSTPARAAAGPPREIPAVDWIRVVDLSRYVGPAGSSLHTRATRLRRAVKRHCFVRDGFARRKPRGLELSADAARWLAGSVGGAIFPTSPTTCLVGRARPGLTPLPRRLAGIRHRVCRRAMGRGVRSRDQVVWEEVGADWRSVPVVAGLPSDLVPRRNKGRGWQVRSIAQFAGSLLRIEPELHEDEVRRGAQRLKLLAGYAAWRAWRLDTGRCLAFNGFRTSRGRGRVPSQSTLLRWARTLAEHGPVETCRHHYVGRSGRRPFALPTDVREVVALALSHNEPVRRIYDTLRADSRLSHIRFPGFETFRNWCQKQPRLARRNARGGKRR
jgi:hypothetical protein